MTLRSLLFVCSQKGCKQTAPAPDPTLKEPDPLPSGWLSAGDCGQHQRPAKGKRGSS